MQNSKNMTGSNSMNTFFHNLKYYILSRILECISDIDGFMYWQSQTKLDSRFNLETNLITQHVILKNPYH